MPYIIPDKRLAVFFSPKSAGTSVRAVMFELENGRIFEPYRVQGKEIDENALLANFRFGKVDQEAIKGYHKIAIIRDPVRRFISAYTNRVLHYRELSEEVAGDTLRELGLPPDPDLETFVTHIGRYVTASHSIRRHTRHQQVFLGDDPDYFDAVFRVEDLAAFPWHLENRYGCRPLTLPRLQTGGPKIKPEDVAPDTLHAIEAVVAEDIAYAFHPAYRDGKAPEAPKAARG